MNPYEEAEREEQEEPEYTYPSMWEEMADRGMYQSDFI